MSSYAEAMGAVVRAARTSTIATMTAGGGRGQAGLQAGAAGQAANGTAGPTLYDDEGTQRQGFLRFGAAPSFGSNTPE